MYFIVIYLSNFSFVAGFAFVYYEDERDAEEAIRALDNIPFGYDKRRLSVEWARVCQCFSDHVLVLFTYQ
jgi:RNA recognition motif-containing protein